MSISGGVTIEAAPSNMGSSFCEAPSSTRKDAGTHGDLESCKAATSLGKCHPEDKSNQLADCMKSDTITFKAFPPFFLESYEICDSQVTVDK